MLDRLKPQAGSARPKKRVGRGNGSGHGRYCGRGVKGQGTRSAGYAVPIAFEGGQMPMARRLPKRGFHNRFRVECEIVNLSDLARLGVGAQVDPQVLKERGLIRGNGAPVKILGAGDAPQKLNVRVDRISAGAREKIEAAGGHVELTAPPAAKTKKMKKKTKKKNKAEAKA